MNPSSEKHSPIVEFLGREAGVGGPFALLGLLHEITDDEQVVRACNRRLQQIDRHRHHSTPDADEARLAVHAAGSQLLDLGLRAELARRWPAGVPVAVPQAWKPIRKSKALPPGFLSKARLLIAASGGWNATARKRLAHFARMNRITALELVQALGMNEQSNAIQRSSAGSPSFTVQVQRPASAQAQNRASFSGASSRERPSASGRVGEIQPPEKGRSVEWIYAYTLLALMGGAVVSTIVIAPPAGLSRESTAVVSSDDLQSGAVNLTEDDAANPESVLAPREDFVHYTAIAHELDQLALQSQTNPQGSLERFEIIYPRFVESWTAFPEPALKRSGLHIAELVSRVSRSSPLVESLMQALACDLSENDPAKLMIRMAVIDVVLSEPRVSAPVRTGLVAISKRCTSYAPRPTSSMVTSLITIAGLEGVDARTDDPIWWTRWLQGVRSVTVDNEDQRTRLVLSAMSARLRERSPQGESWNRTVIELVNAVSWREDAPGRSWLLAQFVDEAVDSRRLSALTEAIAIHSGAKDIDAQMVLNPTATLPLRLRLAKAYRTAWKAAGADDGSAESDQSGANKLSNELRFRVSLTAQRLSEQDAIAACVELARLNTAAWQYARGDTELAFETLGHAADKIAVSGAPTPLDLSTNQVDSQWAQSAINTPSTGHLSTLFGQLVQSQGPGVNAAHALVYLATLHPESDIREQASAQIVRYKDHASVLIAIDHVIGNKRISTRLEKLVLKVVDRSLPSRTDESWYLIAHQSLLAQLSVSIAMTVETDLDVLKDELGSAYALRLDSLGRAAGASRSDLGVLAGAEALYQQLYLEFQSGQGLSSDRQSQIDRVSSYLAVRLARAQSPMHQFLAYQRAICQLHAMRVDRDVPGASLRVADLLSDLETSLNNSTAVIGQITQVERCIAQLWIVAIEGGSP